ncbi:hypothetical protein HPB47_007825 [Ixodes persulcatus]|uniref:Uncharacterized protein n=1 Tax=Ixodes persulcatus TaxID=34615 RepID=A0AC60P6F5_IXOPE|nr:hypothetical protein HPB47_007825 [Ixodes persulcatus]
MRGAIKRRRCCVRIGYCAMEAHSWARGGASASAAAMTSLLWNAQTGEAGEGDSGGPLMLNDYGVYYLIGIVSAGYSCAKNYQPGIYHRVSSSSDWISSSLY